MKIRGGEGADTQPWRADTPLAQACLKPGFLLQHIRSYASGLTHLQYAASGLVQHLVMPMREPEAV